MATMMKVAVFSDTEKVEIREIEKPIPKKGEVLVKVKACALCTWEQRIFKGVSHVPFPFIGGHEVSGIIEELGEDVDENRWKKGQKVALRLLETCGECYYCRMGEQNLCEMIGKKRQNGLAIPGPGGLGEYLTVSSTRLFKIVDDLAFEVGALSEPLACVIHSIQRAHIEIGNDVVIIGAGVMGLFHVMMSKKQAARVIVSEVSEERRRLAKVLGADDTFNPLEEDPIEKIKKITEGRGADVVINTTAISKIAQQATQMVGKTGRVIFYSSQHPDSPISISPDWIHNSEITITGSVSPSISDFQKSTRLLSSRIITPEPLISEVIPFEKVQEAFQKATDPRNYRIIVKMNE
ncbi:MAG: hypothetical protein PWQ68_215 [Thermoanaerobacteraceae bacterium]|nr:hypothetical protein [Thermoanaerobacteraceae bacterium]